MCAMTAYRNLPARDVARCPVPADLPPLKNMLRRLEAQYWRRALLIQFLPDIVGHAGALAPQDRAAWLIGLHKAWNRCAWTFGPSAKKTLLDLADAWAAWPLVAAIGESLRWERLLDAASARQTMDAHACTGNFDAAIDIAVEMQLAYPLEEFHAASWRRLTAQRERCENRGLCTDIHLEDEELRLVKLDHCHVAGFAWQYYDPAIAELCCLPDFSSDEQWHAWLEEARSLGDQELFAVMHRHWGFIGCVGLTLQGTTGFFYYWIGRDFQGNGYGPRAVSLMLEGAFACLGMRRCFAKVYEYNAPSRRALEKMGFEDLGICAAAPDEAQLFYRLGEPAGRRDVAVELHDLLDAMQSDVRAAIPIT